MQIKKKLLDMVRDKIRLNTIVYQQRKCIYIGLNTAKSVRYVI